MVFVDAVIPHRANGSLRFIVFPVTVDERQVSSSNIASFQVEVAVHNHRGWHNAISSRDCAMVTMVFPGSLTLQGYEILIDEYFFFIDTRLYADDTLFGGLGVGC